MVKQVVVIIGTGGMGEAIARRQGSGRKLVLADFDPRVVDRLVGQFDAEGYDVYGHPVDVGERDSLESLANFAASLGEVKEVVHTAGLSPVQAPVEAILRVDLLGVALSLEVFGNVVAHGGAGVVIASMAGHMAPLPPEQESALASTGTDALLGLDFLGPDRISDPGLAYLIAKRANQMRVRAASQVWGARGARINTVSPGVIATAMGRDELNGHNGEVIQGMVKMSGTGRLGTPADIADVVSFLLGPASSFITGTDLLVDGGVVASLTSAGSA